MHNILSETVCSQFNCLWCSSKKRFQGKYSFWMFGQNRGSGKRRIHYLVRLHDQLCLVAHLKFQSVNIIFSLRRISVQILLVFGLFTHENFHLSLKHSLLFYKFQTNILVLLTSNIILDQYPKTNILETNIL